MVENVVNDDVEPKPAIIENYVDVKPSLKSKFSFKLTLKKNLNRYLPLLPSFAAIFLTKERGKERDDLLGWVRRQAAKAGFTIL